MDVTIRTGWTPTPQRWVRQWGRHRRSVKVQCAPAAAAAGGGGPGTTRGAATSETTGGRQGGWDPTTVAGKAAGRGQGGIASEATAGPQGGGGGQDATSGRVAVDGATTVVGRGATVVGTSRRPCIFATVGRGGGERRATHQPIDESAASAPQPARTAGPAAAGAP